VKIKITIKANSPGSKAFKKHLEEKKAFRQAVVNGTVVKYAKANPAYFNAAP
jgi:hypothetical protein